MNHILGSSFQCRRKSGIVLTDVQDFVVGSYVICNGFKGIVRTYKPNGLIEFKNCDDNHMYVGHSNQVTKVISK